jgi:hypothetical protein
MLAAGDQGSNPIQRVYLILITFPYFYPSLPFILPTNFLTLPPQLSNVCLCLLVTAYGQRGSSTLPPPLQIYRVRHPGDFVNYARK